MKMFNWVCRRFHHKGMHADEEVGKVGLLESGGDFDGWKEGILAIGTLASDHYSINDRDHIFNDNKEEIVLVEGEMDEFPLVLKEIKVDDDDDDDDGGGESSDDDDDGVKDSTIEQVKGKVRRITLADLFSADDPAAADNNNLPHHHDDDELNSATSSHHDYESIKKHDDDHHHHDPGVSFILKKKKKKKDDSHRPIKKLNRLMRKMLKRKIYPQNQTEISGGVKLQAMDALIPPTNNPS